MLGVMFMITLTGGSDSSYLLSQINFSLPARHTRNFVPLSLNICIDNYFLDEPFQILYTDYNRLNCDLTLFSLTDNTSLT